MFQLGAAEGWVVTHDGETIKTGFKHDLDAINWMHRRHSFSVAHAIEHEGYDIVLVENGKVTYSYKQAAKGRKSGLGAAAGQRTSDRIDLDRLVTMFKLPEWDAIQEMNVEYIHDVGDDAAIHAHEEGESEEDAEREREQAEERAAQDLYAKWHGAVTAAADEILGAHHLALDPVRPKEKTPFEYRIRPVAGKTWDDAARQIAMTIDGVGLVAVSPEDLRPSRKFVLSHLRWTASYPEVYGTPSASRIYERAW